MAVGRGIIIVSFGDRDNIVLPTIKNVRQYSDLPINLYTDRFRDVKKYNVTLNHVKEKYLQWQDSSRWGVRNCNLFSASAALNTYETCCILNDDMRIVHKGFVDGFELAEQFGICVPMNPRIYVKYNAMGADTTDNDFDPSKNGPEHAPACNVSPMFFCRKHGRAVSLINAYIDELQTCMRGTLAFWKASWKTGISPVYLPEFWCVGASNAKHIRDYKKILRGKQHKIEPMMLHWGQAGVREVFRDII